MINLADVQTVRAELEALAMRLEHSDPNAAMRLRNLEVAIDGGLNLELWASSDLYKVIDPDEITERYKSQARTSNPYALMRMIRTTLLFAFIVITCFGISQAMVSYNNLLSSRPNQVSFPFLYLWQQGFDSLLPAYLIPSSLILIDIILLLGIFVLTLLAMIMIRRSESEATNLHANLVNTLAGATLYLQKNQQSNTLISPSGDLDSVAGRFEQVVKYFAQTAQSLIQFSTMLEKTFEGITKLIAQIEGINNSLNYQQRQIEGSLKEIVNVLHAFTRGQADYSTKQGKWGDLLVEAIESLEQAAQTVVDASGNFSKLADWQAGQRELTGEVHLYVKRFNASLESMERLTIIFSHLTKYLEDFRYKLQTDMQNSLQAFELLPETIKEAIESYADTASSIAKVSKSLDKSAISIHRASEQLLQAVLKPGKNPEIFAEDVAEM